MAVYLLHFRVPYKHARHYLGSSDDLAKRLDQHRKGQGARLMNVIHDAGITFVVARTWEGDRALERQLKRRHGSVKLCPLCNKAVPQSRGRRAPMQAATRYFP